LLKKQDIIDMLSKKQYPKSEYWITAGAGLVMHGVKSETKDIDIGGTTFLADLLIKKGMEWRIANDGVRIITVNDDIELLENWCGDSIVELDGFSISSLEGIRYEKVKLDRPKDWKDIKLIDDFINNRTELIN